MLPGLKMRVGETEENFLELTLLEEVWQEFHCICAKAGDILVSEGMARILGPKGGDAILHVGGDGATNFQTENQGAREEWGEGDQEATEAAANVGDGNGRC